MKRLVTLLFTGLLLTSNQAFSTDSTAVNDTIAFTDTLSAEQMAALADFKALSDSIENMMNYQTGEVQLGEGEAVLHVPEGFKYLNPEQSSYVLKELWGNPSGDSWGMLFLEDESPVLTTYAVNISYEEEGYVSDEDAEELDYDEMMEQLQEEEPETNKRREMMGYESIHIVGWASHPFYDSDNKKLHWAKEIQFGDAEMNTLNYDIRILGRKGILSLNIISDMDQLDNIQTNIDPILTSANFNEGYTYSEFDPEIDKVAAYGIGALVAGKVLAKTGLFAVLAKFSKFIIVGVVALFAGVRKFFTGKKSS